MAGNVWPPRKTEPEQPAITPPPIVRAAQNMAAVDRPETNWLQAVALCLMIVAAFALGVVTGRYSASPATAAQRVQAAETAPIVTELTIDSSEQNPADSHRQDHPAAPQLTAIERQLLQAMLDTKRRDDDGNRRPPLDPQEVGSVGYLPTRAISVTQVLDGGFLGTWHWRITARGGDGNTYMPDNDARQAVMFLGLADWRLEKLHDGQILMPNRAKDHWFFRDAFRVAKPHRYETVTGASRTVIAMRPFDALNVELLADGKSDDELAEVLQALKSKSGR